MQLAVDVQIPTEFFGMGGAAVYIGAQFNSALFSSFVF
jgi:hypothetical protein